MPFHSSDAYRHYEHSVLHNMRYVHEESVRDFLRAVQETSKSRTRILAAGSILWRAQKDHAYRTENKGQPDEMEIPRACDLERMKPILEKATDGRVNPRGILHLYLALEESTACTEVRPWLGSYISLAQFQTKRDLRIVDCTSDERKWLPFKIFNAVDIENPTIIPWAPHEFENVVWGDIGYGMSRPVTLEDSGLSYCPTQIIAESLRCHGADGIAYRSVLAEGGMNITLFDIRDADCINCRLIKTKGIKFTFVPES